MIATRWKLLELEHVVGRQHACAVEIEARKRARVRAGGDHQVLALHLGTVGQAHAVRRRVGDLPSLGEHGDLATLEERVETLGEAVDHLPLARLRPRQVERRHAGVDAEVGGAAGSCGAPPRSGAAPWPGCIPGGGRSHRCAAPRRGRCRDPPPHRRALSCTSRASAEDHDIELLGQDGHLLEVTPDAVSARHEVVTVGTAPFFQAQPRFGSFSSRTFTRPLSRRASPTGDRRDRRSTGEEHLHGARERGSPPP